MTLEEGTPKLRFFPKDSQVQVTEEVLSLIYIDTDPDDNTPNTEEIERVLLCLMVITTLRSVVDSRARGDEMATNSVYCLFSHTS